MKTKKLLFIGLAVSLFASCAQDETTDEVNNARLSDITVSVDGFESDGAAKSARQPGKKKTALQLGSSGLAFSWTQGDVTGVFAENSGQQMPMKMIDGQGTGNKAYFEREDYELKSGVRYVGYYPVVDRLMQDPFIDINYEGQVQEGNGLYSHLAKYDYLVSNPVTVEKTNTADFYFNHQGAILRLMIDMPEADTYSSVTLSAEDNAFTTKAVMDLFNTAEPIQRGTTSKSVTLGFKENSVSTTSGNLQLEAWIMISPADFTSRDMTVTVKSATGKDDVVYTVSPGKNFVKGKAYQIKVPGVDHSKNPLNKWAEYNLVHNEDSYVSSFAKNSLVSGSLYEWGRNHGFTDYNDARGTLTTSGPYGYYYWGYATTNDAYDSELHSGSGLHIYNGYWVQESFLTYEGAQDIKDFPKMYMMNANIHSSNTGDYWVFGNGGNDWYERAAACGYAVTNPCPKGWKLPTEDDFKEIAPSYNLEGSSNLKNVINGRMELKTTKSGVKYAIRWLNSNEALTIQALVVNNGFEETSLSSIDWNDTNVVTRVFPYTGKVAGYIGKRYVQGAYEYMARPMPLGIFTTSTRSLTSGYETVTIATMSVKENMNSSYGGYWMADQKKAFKFTDNAISNYSDQKSCIVIEETDAHDCLAIRCVKAE